MLLVIFCLLGCALAPPSAQEIAMMNAAPKPSSQQAAEEAVQKYFATTLFDAEAARYRFPLPLVQGAWIYGNARQFGWFMCGEVNGKNRMGGYTGYKTFFVYFSPTVPDRVTDGVIADTDQ